MWMGRCCLVVVDLSLQQSSLLLSLLLSLVTLSLQSTGLVPIHFCLSHSLLLLSIMRPNQTVVTSGNQNAHRPSLSTDDILEASSETPEHPWHPGFFRHIRHLSLWHLLLRYLGFLALLLGVIGCELTRPKFGTRHGAFQAQLLIPIERHWARHFHSHVE